MTDAESATADGEWDVDLSVLRARIRTVAVGVGTGLVAGMGAFMYVRNDIAPSHDLPLIPGPDWYPILCVALAGAYVYLLTPDSRESIIAGLVGLVVGVATLIVAVTLPLYILYPSAGRALLIRQYLYEAMPGMINALVLVYFGGYLSTLMVLGFFDV